VGIEGVLYDLDDARFLIGVVPGEDTSKSQAVGVVVVGVLEVGGLSQDIRTLEVDLKVFHLLTKATPDLEASDLGTSRPHDLTTVDE
jgi:hypothetical protein